MTSAVGASSEIPVSHRKARPDDVTVICALARRIWPICYHTILQPHQIENMLEQIYAPANLAEEMQNGMHFWLAACHQEDVAYASALMDVSARVIWLKRLYVLPDLQGRGIGHGLIQKVIESLRDACSIKLLVHRDNLPAQTFYRRFGFEHIGEQPVKMGDFYFVDLLFEKKLTS